MKLILMILAGPLSRTPGRGKSPLAEGTTAARVPCRHDDLRHRRPRLVGFGEWGGLETVTGWHLIRSNDATSYHLGYHSLVTRHLCEACVRHPPVPCSFPSLWGSSRDSLVNSSSTLACRGKKYTGCGALRFVRYECRVSYFVFCLGLPFLNLAGESGLMSNYNIFINLWSWRYSPTVIYFLLFL